MKIWNVLVNNHLELDFIFSFLPQKQKQKSSPLGEDAKTQRRRVSKFLCVSESLRLCVFNFLTLFIRGGKQTALDQNFEEIKIFHFSLDSYLGS